MRFFLCAVMVSLCGLIGVTRAIAQPRIAVAAAELYFDTLYQGQTVIRTTVVTNRGTSPLIIEHIDAACECSRPSMKKMTLLPGEKEKLTVAFDGQLYNGDVHKMFLIVSNDKVNRNKRVGVNAYVRPVFRIEPGQLAMSLPDSEGRLDTARITLTNVTKKRLNIASVVDSAGKARGWLEHSTIAPGQSVELASLPAGNVISGTIGVFTLKFRKSLISQLKVPYYIRQR